MKGVISEIEPGIFEFFSDYVPSTRRTWYLRTEAVLNAEGRAKDVCERCGRKTKYTQKHHKDRNYKNTRSDNIEVLCIECHMEEHPERLNFKYLESLEDSI